METLKNWDTEYSEYRYLWNLTAERKRMTEVPLHLDIELTNHCNLRCSMCWQAKYLSYPKGYMDYNLFKKIIDDGSTNGVKAIKLQSRGESMLHPKIIDSIAYAKKNMAL